MNDVVTDVVVVADPSDVHCDVVCRHLVSQGSTPLRFNLSDLRSARMSAEVGSVRLHIDNETFLLSRETTVWWRRVGSIDISDLGAEEARLATDEGPHLFIGAMAAAGVRFVDNPPAVWWAEIKQFQLSVAQQLGIAIPATRITNDPEAARTFALGRRTVAKAVSPGVGIAPFVGEVLDSDLDFVRALPTMLQELVEASADFRIVVVGRDTWVWRRPRERGTIDWRQVDPAGSGFKPVEDKGLSELALKVTHGLGLSMSVQDWLEAETGPVFLESNAQGAWLFLPRSTDFVVPAIVRHLNN
jgi:hypothetical protein